MVIPDPQPHSQSRLADLLLRSSVAARAGELTEVICAATPSIALGVPEVMADIARVERSVSAAGLPVADGSPLGTFNGDVGVFADSRKLAAELHGGDDALVLTAGSTCGNQIVSKVLAARGATVLVVANAHHSTVLGLIEDDVDFLRLEVDYDTTFEAPLAPTPTQIHGTLELHPQIDAVWITSPSYEGQVADVAAIAVVCRRHGAILIVDSAWGAHFPFHPSLPDAPCNLGADITVTSLHKLGGGPQGTALLVYRTTRVGTSEIEDARTKVITTSPSMVLLGGADAAMREMAVRGAAHLERTFQIADELIALVADDLPLLRLFASVHDCADPTRVTFATDGYGMTGHELARSLCRHGIACEKASTHAITFLMAMGLPDNAALRIADALRLVLTQELRVVSTPGRPINPWLGMKSGPTCTPGGARRLGKQIGRRVALKDAAGQIATEMVEVYPPGIPVIVPGFAITQGAIDVIRNARHLDADVQGTGDLGEQITVISPHDISND
jgi:arginine decarboxylase